MSNVPAALPERSITGARVIEWFKTRERGVLAVGIAVQFLVLAGMIVLNAIPYFNGRAVLLKVRPVDPRDAFRGDYVILGYDFNRLPAAGIPGLPARGESAGNWQSRTVFVSLLPDADGIHYHAGSWSLTPPTDGLFLRGKTTAPYRAEFGIESFFVQEGKGHDYESALRASRLWAEVLVSPDGQAAVKSLRIE